MPHDPTHFLAEHLHRLLPDAIASATHAYHDFCIGNHPADTKSFSAHHTACKAAVGHLLALTKLTQWLDKQKPSTPQHDTLETLLLQARQILVADNNNEPENQF